MAVELTLQRNQFCVQEPSCQIVTWFNLFEIGSVEEQIGGLVAGQAN